MKAIKVIDGKLALTDGRVIPGKGDHIHYGDGREMPYRFTSLENLIRDFYADIETLSGAIL
ncbi:MAG: hypothetical protein U1F76_24670 [Candidatus Competibacteraceae bacterium]